MTRAALIILCCTTSLCSCEEKVEFQLNYDDLIYLDAEDLAEAGVKDAYDSLLPLLQQYVDQPAPIVELLDNEAPSYAVTCGNEIYPIYSPDLEDSEGRSWGRATYALFAIVNAQLTESKHRFYAINGGNDLGGMFLEPAEADLAQASLERKSDWPYIPTSEHPMYGQNF